ncbi:MAG: HD family hydrolase [Pyrinomonadaceae bacterium]
MLSALIELQRLKRLERTGWMLRGLPIGTESVAAHSFGVAITAMMLADEIQARGVDLDIERVIRQALLHDWAETRVGDLPKTATEYFEWEARKKAEAGAFGDIVKDIGVFASQYRALYRDYEQRESIEARLVKAADTIDLLIQTLALERAGAKGLDEFYEVAHQRDFQLPAMAQKVVDNVLQSILEARNNLR